MKVSFVKPGSLANKSQCKKYENEELKLLFLTCDCSQTSKKSVNSSRKFNFHSVELYIGSRVQSHLCFPVKIYTIADL